MPLLEFAVEDGKVRRMTDAMRKRFPNALAGRARQAMHRAALLVEREIKLNIVRTFRRKKGTLANSFGTAVFHTSDGFFAVVGSELPYARIHETGGTIVPKRARMLTVPVNERVARLGMRARDFPDAFVLRRRGKNPLLVRPGSRGGLEPLFVLVRSVRIPERPYVRPAVDATEDRVLRLNVTMVMDAMAQAGLRSGGG